MSFWDLRKQVRQRVERERGTLRKQAQVRVALCYPSVYSVGMSSLGFQTIYREIHLNGRATAERAFLPDTPAKYRDSRTPVFTYESETPISDFPIVAFSIAYELELPDLLEILDLSGIPVLRTERDSRHPMIVAGGPLTNSNPLPLVPFVDLIILGEGEDLIHGFLDAAAVLGREDLVSEFSGRSGCFVPGRDEDLPTIAKVADARLPARSQIMTEDTVLSSMFLIEPERGCSRGCTYCVMRRTTNGGMRLVSPETVLSLIPEDASRVGLVGAAVTDHPQIKDLVRGIVEQGREIGISSLRADRLDREFVELLHRGGARTLTTAADGASERVRKLVDRKTTERHLLNVAGLVRDVGLQQLKLYEMIGLPGETATDVEELIRFSLELSRLIPLALSISPFVAKRNTPLDGSAFEPIRSIEAKMTQIRLGLNRNVEISPTSARWAWVEYMLSQAGEDAGLAAMDAWRAGRTFASWKRAFAGRGVTPFRYRPVPDGRRNVPALS